MLARLVCKSLHSPRAVAQRSLAAFTNTARQASQNSVDNHNDDKDDKEITLKWKRRDGSIKVTKAKVGATLLRSAQKYDIELEEDVYSRLPEASEDEEDMLDQAFGLTSTSRLGCQVAVTEDMHDMLITIPSATRNFYVDGHVPKPH